MYTRIAAAGLLVCALGACAANGDDPRMTAGRPIQVRVISGGGVEAASVDEEPIHRKAGDRNDIKFQLRTKGYRFPASGAITFDDVRQAPEEGEIQCRTDGSAIVVCRNRHSTAGTYKYTLHVLRADGTEVLPALDPFIVNH